MVPTPRSGSVVSDFVAAVRNAYSVVGSSRSFDDVAFCITEDRKACWRPIRCRSDPSPIDVRTRTYCRAWRPSRVCVPGASRRWVCASSMATGVHTCTPPSA